MANVLVVDDATFMRLSIKQILEKNGHTIIAEAADGKEAIEKYNKSKPPTHKLDNQACESGAVFTPSATVQPSLCFFGACHSLR